MEFSPDAPWDGEILTWKKDGKQPAPKNIGIWERLGLKLRHIGNLRQNSDGTKKMDAFMIGSFNWQLARQFCWLWLFFLAPVATLDDVRMFAVLGKAVSYPPNCIPVAFACQSNLRYPLKDSKPYCTQDAVFSPLLAKRSPITNQTKPKQTWDGFGYD